MSDTAVDDTVSDDAAVLRAYDVGNTSGKGFWCLAYSPDDAAALACELGHVRDPANARVHDVHDRMLAHERGENIAAFITMGARGRLALHMEETPGGTLLNPAPMRSQWIIQDADGFMDPAGNRAQRGCDLDIPE